MRKGNKVNKEVINQQIDKGTSRLLTCVLTGMLLTGCGSSDQEAASESRPETPTVAAETVLATHPDFTGVWQVIDPVMQLTTSDGKTPPLLPESQSLYEERVALFEAGNVSDYDPVFQGCKPMGAPRNLYDGSQPESIQPFEIQQREDALMFGYTFNRALRFVDIVDQFREIPGPTYYGTSIAHWDGDSLEITGKKYQQSTLLDAAGMTHSDELVTVERLRLLDENTLEDRITYKDPKTFSNDWEATFTFRKLPADTRIQDDFCLQRLNIKLFTPLKDL